MWLCAATLCRVHPRLKWSEERMDCRQSGATTILVTVDCSLASALYPVCSAIRWLTADKIDLLRGRKIYDRGQNARGPTNYATQKANGSIEYWNGHPLFAIRPKNGVAGVVADYGSFSRERSGSSRNWPGKALECASSFRATSTATEFISSMCRVEGKTQQSLGRCLFAGWWRRTPASHVLPQWQSLPKGSMSLST
jgi:hypothetical protein